MFPSLRCNDCCVQREQIGAAGDVFDHREDLTDLTNAALQFLERRCRAVGDITGDVDPFDRFRHRSTARLGVFADLSRQIGRRLRGRSQLRHC